MARVGLQAGVNCPNNMGAFFVRASYLYDLDGETSTTARMANAKDANRFDQDFGGGWYEFGLGANFSLTPVPTFMSTLNASMRARWSKTGAATSASDTSSSRLALREPEGLPV